LYGFLLRACGILSASGGDSKYILNRFWLFFDSWDGVSSFALPWVRR
jgi:hypothetical protein